jgi:hypothetical protein
MFKDSFDRSVLPMSVIAHIRGRCVTIRVTVWLAGIRESSVRWRTEECGSEDDGKVGNGHIIYV